MIKQTKIFLITIFLIWFNFLFSASANNNIEQLISAIVNQDIIMVERIVARLPDINEAHNGITPLLAAVKTENKEIINIILSKDANLLRRYNDGGLIFSCIENKEIKEFLITNIKDLNKKDRCGLRLLDIAVQTKDLETVKILLEKGAAVNVEEPAQSDHLNSLVFAAEQELIDLLLKNRADIKAKNRDGQTILMLAVMNNNYLLVENLLNKNVDVLTEDRFGKNAYFYAEEPEMLELLMTKTPKDLDINELLGGQKRVKIDELIYLNDLPYMEYLIEKGLDINVTNNYGETALIFAVKYKKPQFAKLLLDNNANVTIKGLPGKTAVDYLLEMDPVDQEILTLFKQKNYINESNAVSIKNI